MLDISQVTFAKPSLPRAPKPLSKGKLKKRLRAQKRAAQREVWQARREAKKERLDELTEPSMLADIRGECDIYGLALRISYTESGKTTAPRHWMFVRVDNGERVLDWWPTTGKTWSRVTFQKRVVHDVWQVVRLAGECKEKMR